MTRLTRVLLFAACALRTTSWARGGDGSTLSSERDGGKEQKRGEGGRRSRVDVEVGAERSAGGRTAQTWPGSSSAPAPKKSPRAFAYLRSKASRSNPYMIPEDGKKTRWCE